MWSRTVLLASLATLASITEVSAHGHVSEILIRNQSYYGHDPTKVPWGPQPDSISWTNGAHDNGFVPSTAADLASPDIVCHLNATNGLLTAPVTAGNVITLRWSDWPAAHWGPVVDYMARCPNDDCTSVDKNELRFFKIAEMGRLEPGPSVGTAGYWANNKLRDDDFSWNVTVPEKLAPGSYILRHEVIALHPGGAEGTTQMYPQCVNLVVQSGGDAEPEGVLATELYTSTDPGLTYNVYIDEYNPPYQIPGPAVEEF